MKPNGRRAHGGVKCACKHLQFRSWICSATVTLAWWDGKPITILTAWPRRPALGDGTSGATSAGLRPHVITCYDEQGGYGHPYHLRSTVSPGGVPRCWRGHALSRAWPPPLAASQLYYIAYPCSLFSRATRSCVPWEPESRPIAPTLIRIRSAVRRRTHHHARRYPRLFIPKMNALRCHRTEIAPDWWGKRVPHEVLRVNLAWSVLPCRVTVPVAGS